MTTNQATTLVPRVHRPKGQHPKPRRDPHPVSSTDRTWTGWRHHIIMCLVGETFLLT